MFSRLGTFLERRSLTSLKFFFFLVCVMIYLFYVLLFRLVLVIFFPSTSFLSSRFFKFIGLKFYVKKRNIKSSLYLCLSLYLHLYLGSRCWSCPFTDCEIGLAAFSPHGSPLTVLHLGFLPRFSFSFVRKGLQAPWFCSLSV